MVVRRREIIKQIGEKLGLSKFVRSEQEIQKIEQELAARQQAQPMKLEPSVDADKIFDKLMPTEQAQILASIGIKPDPRRMGGMTPQATQQPMPVDGGFHQMPDGGIMPDGAMPYQGEA
jgi:hypothetical protein